jgi:hypothetical protein
MKRAIATVLLVFGVAINLVAQSAFKDTIYLKDKSYYFGFITEINMRDSLRPGIEHQTEGEAIAPIGIVGGKAFEGR